ncbi:MAG: DDE-type integrase/transposase/recombinase [Candidatus Uhrbacteria bacterium]|nr:DDE-type integrase/transposase/recombinase [Candidatus Uhrbacteria bacterium]
MYSQEQYLQFLPLRRKYLRYGKEKLLRIYRREYPDDGAISLWNIQRMIERSGLYWSAKKNESTQRRRRKTRDEPRKKILDLPKEARSGFLLCMDTVHRSCNGRTRYILTAIDPYSKVAFARAYTTHSSATAKDFLCRLYYLLDGRITNVHTDNGSEFGKHFERTLKRLNIPHYFSRPRTPKDNAVNERFNRILDEECLKMGNMTDNLTLLNARLTDWLIEYNFRRPHQALNYEPPMNYHYRKLKVLPMCPSSTLG